MQSLRFKEILDTPHNAFARSIAGGPIHQAYISQAELAAPQALRKMIVFVEQIFNKKRMATSAVV